MKHSKTAIVLLAVWAGMIACASLVPTPAEAQTTTCTTQKWGQPGEIYDGSVRYGNGFARAGECEAYAASETEKRAKAAGAGTYKKGFMCHALTWVETTCVTTAPPPPPTPAVVTGPGLGQIPVSPYRVNAGYADERIGTTTEVAQNSSDGTGDFRTRCLPSHFAFDDPIVFPGQVGRSHLHVFFANTLASATSTAQSLLTTGNSTCRGGTANRSSYWVPAIVDTATNLPVVPDESDFYYKSGYRGVRPDTIKPMPTGLRMIAGDPTNRVAPLYFSPFQWVCHNSGLNRGFTIPDCPVGDQLELSLTFPQCWDGVNLDSPDHKSHMAYGTGSGCPPSHPVPLPEVSFHVLWPITRAGQTATWRLSSDTYTGPAGYSAHGDWFNGWKKDVSDAWSTRCVAAGKDCHSHLLGDGRTIN